ncbi:MAG: DUF4296 domain-containing protein [Bacteroidales bacterium]|jgi:hypothetical protein|nr:DUF4296 domain-containing protein [Bacteroidales bacterium]
MFKKILFGIFAAALCISCSQSNKRTVVFELIPKQTMAKMLFDVHFSDAVINTHNNQDRPNLSLSTAHYDSLFAKYGFSDTVFRLNVEHYTLTGDIQAIYEIVLDSLNNMQARIVEERIRNK